MLERAPGQPASQRSPSDHETHAYYRQAGSWLQRLHTQTPLAPDPLPLEAALRRRFRAALSRASRVLPSAAVEGISAWAERASIFADERRVICHRDFGPHNWLVSGVPPTCIVIDFEHCRADAREADFVKLVAGPFTQNPKLEQAFWDGYGEHPGPALRARIEWFVVYFALATLAWTVVGREPARTAQARSLLASRGLLPGA